MASEPEVETRGAEVIQEASLEVSDLGPRTDRPVDLEVVRVRGTLAYMIVGQFAGTVLLCFVILLFNQDAWPATKELLPYIIPIQSFMLGATKDHWLPSLSPKQK